jgi:nitrogen fixation/metabolism regulation signal transduction histidine kinase
MSRIGLRIVSALLVVSVVPLVFAVLTFRWTVEHTLELGLSPEVEAVLETATAFPRRIYEAQSARLALLTQLLQQRLAGLPAPSAGGEAPDRLTGLIRGLDVRPGPVLVGLEQGDGWQVAGGETEAPPVVCDTFRRQLEQAEPGEPFLFNVGPGVSFMGLIGPEQGERGRVAAAISVRADLRLEAETLHGTLITYRHLNYLVARLKFRITLFFLVVMSLVILGSLAAGIAISRGITRRLAALAAATRQVAVGDYNLVLPRGGPDELGQLIDSFRGMAGELQQSRERIIYLEKMALWKDMARKLAHEIKNPLSPIQMGIQELRDRYPAVADGGGEAERAEFATLLEESAEMVLEETGRLKRMVQAFSSFARLPDPVPEALDLNEAVRRFFDRHLDYGEQLEVSLGLADGLPPAWFDPDQLVGILRNLADNAVQLGMPGLRLRVESSSPGPGWLQLTVSDNGPGIPPSERRLVFEPSFSGRPDGMGLGLAIVKKSVLDHGGWISVEDAEPRGARFVIRIPAARETKERER